MHLGLKYICIWGVTVTAIDLFTVRLRPLFSTATLFPPYRNQEKIKENTSKIIKLSTAVTDKPMATFIRTKLQLHRASRVISWC